MKFLRVYGMYLAVNWSHRLLPNGEYPESVDQLIDAFPELGDKSKYEIEKRISQYTGKPAIMVRAVVDEEKRKRIKNVYDNQTF